MLIFSVSFQFYRMIPEGNPNMPVHVQDIVIDVHGTRSAIRDRDSQANFRIQMNTIVENFPHAIKLLTTCRTPRTYPVKLPTPH